MTSAGEQVFDRDGSVVLAAELGDIPVLVETGPGVVYRLNQAATIVWKSFAAGEPACRAAHGLVAAFDITERQAEQDARALLGDWEARGWQWRALPHKTPRSTAKRRDLKVSRAAADRADCIDYALNGHSFRICYPTDSDEPIRTLLSAWKTEGVGVAPCFRLIAGGVERYTLLRDHEVLLDEVPAIEARRLLLHTVACLVHGTERLAAVLHAGAMSDGQHAVIMAARSGSGKSTLCAALIGEGLRYCSDDFLPIRAGDSRVLPFPTTLNLKEGSWSLFRSRYPQLARLDNRGSHDRWAPDSPCPGAPTQGGYPACALVFPRYRSGAELHVAKLVPPVALSRLSEAGVWLGPPPHDPADIRSFLRWIGTLPAHELTYGDMEPAVRWIMGLFP